jgi:hypothetical protein
MTDVIGFDAFKVRKYLTEATDGFFNDPPGDRYQQGFLAALVVVMREAIGRDDDRLKAADAMTSWTLPEQEADDDAR